MKLETITEGLQKLLEENNYNPQTIKAYQREWKKIQSFLIEEYGDTEFSMEKGIAFLEKQYQIVEMANSQTLTQSKVQRIRVIHMLEDYSLHRVITRRYTASKNQINLCDEFNEIHEGYVKHLNECDLSNSTVKHYSGTSKVFLDYLQQLHIEGLECISMETCSSFIKTMSEFGFKTVEQVVCGLRHFLRFLCKQKIIESNYAEQIHMPPISKTAKIPSVWSFDELKALLAVIDRNNPLGKRDYSMILLACVLGIRSIDIKNLRFSDFDWENNKLSFIQHKTKKPISLPLPKAVGWAVIDYIKNGRPSYFDTDRVFLQHMPPFREMGDDNHMSQIIKKYMHKAGIKRENKHSGFHSLRHSTASMLLEMETPLPVITNILGHTDSDVTAIYLKTDLMKLAECVLQPPEEEN